MRRPVRIAIALLCLIVLVQTLVLWRRTGGAGLTRYRDPAPAAADARSGDDRLRQLLDEAGLEEQTGPMPRRADGFALGLLPSGGGVHMISVLTIAGPALAAGALAMAPGRRPSIRKKRRPAPHTDA